MIIISEWAYKERNYKNIWKKIKKILKPELIIEVSDNNVPNVFYRVKEDK